MLHRTVKLHPAAVLLALLAGASLGGILGMLVAAPAVAALKVLVGHFWRVYVLGQTPEELEPAGSATEERRRLWLPRRVAESDGTTARDAAEGPGTELAPARQEPGQP